MKFFPFLLLPLFFVSQVEGFSGATTTFKIFGIPLPQQSAWYAMNITGTPNAGTILILNGSRDIVFSFYNTVGNASIPSGSVNLTFYVLQNSASYRVLVSTPNAMSGDLFNPAWIWLNFTVNPVLGWNKAIFNLPARTLLFHSFIVIDIIRTSAGVTKILLGNSTYPAIFRLDPEWSLSQPVQTPTFGDIFLVLDLVIIGFVWSELLLKRVRRRA